MAFCEPCWCEHAQGEHRTGTERRCYTCGIGFSSGKAYTRHILDPETPCTPIAEFRCCDCDIEFATEWSFRNHLHDEHPITAPLPPRVRSVHYCEECDRSFQSKSGLKAHKANARVHNPLLAEDVKCVGGCSRTFNAPSGLISHLESGACKSGFTRGMLDKAIIEHDTANIITDPDAVLARQTGNLSLTDDDFSSMSGAIDTPDGWSDSDGRSTPLEGTSEGTATPSGYYYPGASRAPITADGLSESESSGTSGIIFTPSTGSTGSRVVHKDMSPISSGPAINQIRAWLLPNGSFECPLCPDGSKIAFERFAELQEHMNSPIEHLEQSMSYASSESGISTTSTLPAHPYCLPTGKYECPLCPTGSRRLFKTLISLQNHMISPIAHMPKIYHCPDPALLGIVLAPGSRKKKEKSFPLLSALAQHVESGACRGGRPMFKAVVGFVNEKLSDAGLGEMRMIAAE